MSRILIVLTGARLCTQRDGSRRPSGFWAEEFVVPHRLFTEAGLAITIATIGGRAAGVDPGDFDGVFVPGGHGPLRNRQERALAPDGTAACLGSRVRAGSGVVVR
jgi:putative intracellular protease/amidase